MPAQLALTCPALLVTLTVTVQVDAPAGTCRLVVVMVPVPAVAIVAAAALAQVPPTLDGFATRNPEGSESTKPTFDTAGVPAGLLRVNVNTVVPPSAIIGGANALSSVCATVASTNASAAIASHRTDFCAQVAKPNVAQRVTAIENPPGS